jgi:hypothetical protein
MVKSSEDLTKNYDALKVNCSEDFSINFGTFS